MVPCDPGERERTAAVLARFGEPGDAGTKGAAVLLAGGDAELAEVVRALDAEGIAIETLQLHAPSLDDVFLAKTGRSLEGCRRGDRGGRRRPRRSGRGGVNSAAPHQVGQLARRSVVRTLRQPAQRSSPADLPDVPAGGELGRPEERDHLPGFPTDSYLTFALAITFMQGALFAAINSGTDLARDIETGFLNRLALTPMRGAALLSGLLGGSLMLGTDAGARLPDRRPRLRRPN